jgi:hypothetical protein
MAGYSQTPLAKKLGIKEGHKIALIRAPPTFRTLLGALPEKTELQTALAGKALFDVIVAFVTRRDELQRQISVARLRMDPAARLWIAWPKRASGVPTDVTENVVRELALPTGLVDNKVCAIDDTWSGLQLVIRRELR